MQWFPWYLSMHFYHLLWKKTMTMKFMMMKHQEVLADWMRNNHLRAFVNCWSKNGFFNEAWVVTAIFSLQPNSMFCFISFPHGRGQINLSNIALIFEMPDFSSDKIFPLKNSNSKCTTGLFLHSCKFISEHLSLSKSNLDKFEMVTFHKDKDNDPVVKLH